jgi:hypothetical protein
MIPTKETKTVYRKILLASLYKDFSQYQHKFQKSGYVDDECNYYTIDYNPVVIKIHIHAFIGKVQVINKTTGEYFYFLSVFNFWFNKNLRIGYYTILKKYFSDTKIQKQLEANRKSNEDFLNSLPINLARLEKIKEILDT